MAIEDNRLGEGKDIPKGRKVGSSGVSPDAKPNDYDYRAEQPTLSKYTHTKIVLTMADLVPPDIGYVLTPEEILGYDKAVNSGRLDYETVVGREVNVFSKLNCNNPHNRDRAVITTFITFNEAYGLSDDPAGEKVLAKVVRGIDFDSGHPNERSAYLTLYVRENDTVGFDFATYGQTDQETTLAMEKEFSELGLDLDFENDPRKYENGELNIIGEFNEQQGSQLLHTLREKARIFREQEDIVNKQEPGDEENFFASKEPQVGQQTTIADQEETIAEFPKVGKKNKKTK